MSHIVHIYFSVSNVAKSTKVGLTDFLVKPARLHTGDIGYYDERENLFLVDRLKELIKVISMSAVIKIRNKKWLKI